MLHRLPQVSMQVAVIGGGVAGVCTAYFLAQAGHEVVVIERQSNVAEGASFGSAGVLSPVHALPWAAPGMPKKLLSMLLKRDAPLSIEPRVNRQLWQWARRWIAECEIGRYQINAERSYRIAAYSNAVVETLRQQHGFEYERTRGYLQLYRTPHERDLAAPVHAFLGERGVPHQVLEPESVYAIEPALRRTAVLSGGLHLPEDVAGNCPLYCKQVRAAAQSLGVDFHFSSEVTAIETAPGAAAGLFLRIGGARFGVDAAVVAAGEGSHALLAPLGVKLPFFPVRRYAATASIRNFDDAPLASVSDSSYSVSITRMGTRMRLAGTAEVGARTTDMRPAAIATLLKVAQQWFPDAANYNAATKWSGIVPTLPDGAPILGPTPVANLYLNIGHGANSWAMAPGCARVLADLLSGRATDIDTDGLTMSRYG